MTATNKYAACYAAHAEAHRLLAAANRAVAKAWRFDSETTGIPIGSIASLYEEQADAEERRAEKYAEWAAEDQRESAA